MLLARNVLLAAIAFDVARLVGRASPGRVNATV